MKMIAIQTGGPYSVFEMPITGKLHNIGDPYCSACPTSFPRRHLNCKGLVHTEPLPDRGGPTWVRQCDQCKDGEVVTGTADPAAANNTFQVTSQRIDFEEREEIASSKNVARGAKDERANRPQ